jgi:hypothetical protein
VNGISPPLPSLESGIVRFDPRVCGSHPSLWLSFPQLSPNLLQFLRERVVFSLTLSNPTVNSLSSVWWLELAYLLSRDQLHNRPALLRPPQNWHIHLLSALETFVTATLSSQMCTVGAHRTLSTTSPSLATEMIDTKTTLVTVLKLSYSFLILMEFCSENVAGVKETLVCHYRLFNILTGEFSLASSFLRCFASSILCVVVRLFEIIAH